MCIKHLGISYNDAMKMPTRERRMYLGFLRGDREAEEEHLEKLKDKKNGRVTGDEVKNFAKQQQ